MKFFAGLVPVQAARALPIIVCEIVYDYEEEIKDLVRQIYHDNISQLKFKESKNKVDLFKEYGIVEYSFNVQDKFINCLETSKVLFVEFHIWLEDKEKFFINTFLTRNENPESVEINYNYPIIAIKDSKNINYVTKWRN